MKSVSVKRQVRAPAGPILFFSSIHGITSSVNLISAAAVLCLSICRSGHLVMGPKLAWTRFRVALGQCTAFESVRDAELNTETCFAHVAVGVLDASWGMRGHRPWRTSTCQQ